MIPFRLGRSCLAFALVLCATTAAHAAERDAATREQARAGSDSASAATPANDSSPPATVTPAIAAAFEHPAPHDDRGFANSDGSRIEPSFLDVLKFYWEMLTTKRELPPADRRPMVPDLGYLKQNRGENTVTWIGHSTVLVQIGGLNVLTDPQFSERASPFTWIGPKRRTPPAMSIDELPPIDVVVVSHDHYDHLDEASVRLLVKQRDPLFIVPLGMDKTLREWGAVKVKALDWWQHDTVKSPNGTDVEVHAVPVHHWSRRGIFDRNESLWAGYVVRTKDFSVFFAGDTGYSEDFLHIGEKFGPIDIAAIPVGAYEPRWFMKPQHANPDDAVRIHRDVRSKHSIGIHWGTFELTTEPIDAPRTALPQALQAANVDPASFELFRLGQTFIQREQKPAAEARGQSRKAPKRQWRRGEPR